MYSNLMLRTDMCGVFIFVSASLPFGRPKETISTRHGFDDITSQQLVSCDRLVIYKFTACYKCTQLSCYFIFASFNCNNYL